MLPSWSSLAEYLRDQTQRTQDLAGLCRRFKALVAPFEIDTIASGRLHLHDRNLAAFFTIDWPEAWRAFYFRSGMVERDPLLDRLQEATEVFTWSELRSSRRISKAGSEALARAAEHGWTEGIVVPVDVSLPFAGLVSLVARRSAFSNEEKAFLTLISTHFYQRAKDLSVKAGLALAPASLTPREIACLQLVAQGYSDRRVGEALGISMATAHEHVESAKKKLSAGTRSKMIAAAYSLAIIQSH